LCWLTSRFFQWLLRGSIIGLQASVILDMNLQQWNHFAVVCSATATTFYVNGSPLVALAPFDPTLQIDVVLQDNFFIGRGLNGFIQSVGMWGEALSSGDVQALFNRRGQRMLLYCESRPQQLLLSLMRVTLFGDDQNVCESTDQRHFPSSATRVHVREESSCRQARALLVPRAQTPCQTTTGARLATGYLTAIWRSPLLPSLGYQPKLMIRPLPIASTPAWAVSSIWMRLSVVVYRHPQPTQHLRLRTRRIL
jgi:hypothetical protein